MNSSKRQIYSRLDQMFRGATKPYSFYINDEREKRMFADGRIVGSFFFVFCVCCFAFCLYLSSGTHFSTEKFSKPLTPGSQDHAALFTSDIFEQPAHSGQTSFRNGEHSRNSQNQISTRQMEFGVKAKSPGSFDACRSFFRTPGRTCPFRSLKEPLYLWNRIFLI